MILTPPVQCTVCVKSMKRMGMVMMMILTPPVQCTVCVTSVRRGTSFVTATGFMRSTTAYHVGSHSGYVTVTIFWRYWTRNMSFRYQKRTYLTMSFRYQKRTYLTMSFRYQKMDLFDYEF